MICVQKYVLYLVANIALYQYWASMYVINAFKIKLQHQVDLVLLIRDQVSYNVYTIHLSVHSTVYTT